MKCEKLAWLVTVLILSACQNQPSPTVELPRGGGLARGIDLPTDASDVINSLKGSRLDFIARYYRDPASRWPTLTASEAQRLSSLGFKLVTIWETHSHRPDYFSYSSGYSDAMNAYRQAKTIAQPSGSAIYFAVDFNARGDNLLQVDQYFRGIGAHFAAASGGRPEYKVGVYGSGAVCDAIKGAMLAQYCWLSGSTAWAGSLGYTGWNIRQAAMGARFASLSFDHDANEARDDYGGFVLAGFAGATPAVAAVSPVAGVPEAPQPDRSFATIAIAQTS